MMHHNSDLDNTANEKFVILKELIRWDMCKPMYEKTRKCGIVGTGDIFNHVGDGDLFELIVDLRNGHI